MSVWKRKRKSDHFSICLIVSKVGTSIVYHSLHLKIQHVGIRPTTLTIIDKIVEDGFVIYFPDIRQGEIVAISIRQKHKYIPIGVFLSGVSDNLSISRLLNCTVVPGAMMAIF